MAGKFFIVSGNRGTMHWNTNSGFTIPNLLFLFLPDTENGQLITFNYSRAVLDNWELREQDAGSTQCWRKDRRPEVTLIIHAVTYDMTPARDSLMYVAKMRLTRIKMGQPG